MRCSYYKGFGSVLKRQVQYYVKQQCAISTACMVCMIYSLNLKMEPVQTKLDHIPDDSTVHSHCYENLKSHVMKRNCTQRNALLRYLTEIILYLRN
jgi:hypothetical protein